MAGEIRTLSLTVDLECRICSKMIKKAICKLQERERIQKIEYDEKENKVTISGPFDPVKLKNKLCCKACKAIKSINIVEKKKEEPKKEKKEEPKTDQPPPDSGTKKPEPVCLPYWPVGLTMPVCYMGCKDICRCCTCGCGGVEHHSLPVISKPPVGLTMPVCRCRPCNVGYNDTCRCCTCGCGGVGHHSLPVVGKPVTYQFSCEEAPPSCSVM